MPYRFPLVQLLANLLESLNPTLPFDSSPPKGDEYTSRWFTSPLQHAIETLISILLFGPLLVVTWRRMTAQMRARRITYTPTKAQVVWSYFLLLTFVLQVRHPSLPSFWPNHTLTTNHPTNPNHPHPQVPLKLDVKKISSHPAYFLQPCHVSTILFFLCTVVPSETAFITFHSLSLLTWGPSLAFIFPNYPSTPYEVLFFHLQHIFLVTAPVRPLPLTHPPTHPSIHPAIHPATHPTIHSSIHPSIYPTLTHPPI